MAARQRDKDTGHAPSSKSGETSSLNHRKSHQYAALDNQFPGWLGTGGTVQQLAQPVVLAEANVGAATVRRADKGTSPRRRKAESSN